MSAPTWLLNYYGNEFDKFNPTVVFEGNKKAVVRLVGNIPRGYNNIAYVLIDKNGQHNSSDHKSLHEGLPTEAVMQQMKSTLETEDK